MPSSSVRVAALLIAASFTLAACAPPGVPRGATSSSSIDQPTAVSQPDGQKPVTAVGSTAAVGLDIGQRAPAFVVTGLDGRQISDVDLRAQGKPYILYFYATW